MSVSARLGAYYFAFFAYAGVLVPYFSLYLAAQGFGAAEIALVVAMPQVARLFAPAFWGWLGDATGRQREIVIFSAFAVLAGFIALGAVRGVAGTALLMLVLGALAAGALPLVEAITLSLFEGNPGKYGPVRLWGSIGFILAVLGGGVWLDRHGAQAVLAVLIAAAALVCATALLVPRAPRPHAAGTALRLGAVLARGEVRGLLGAGACMAAAHGALYTFYSIHLDSVGYSKSLIGALWMLGVVAEVLLFLRLPQIMRRFSLRALLLASFACAVLRFAAIACGAESLVILALAQLLHAATFGAFHAASVAAIHRLFPGPMHGRGQAIHSSLSYGLGAALGTLAAGWTWEALGAAGSFAVSAAFGAAGGLLVAWKVRV